MTETKHVQIPVECSPLDLSRPHFAGIGGAGMSALARLLVEQGAQVSGSDLNTTAVTERLASAGCRVHAGHHLAHLQQPSVVVWSSVIAEDNEELVAARAAGITVAHRSHVLAQLMNEAGRRSVVVAGTHGKSTTTAMLAAALERRDPSWAGGGALLGGTNAHYGAGQVFIAEGDESDRSIINYRPAVAVLLNAEDDHPENYTGLAETVGVFRDFALAAEVLVVSADDPGAGAVTELVRGREGLRVVTFGQSKGADVHVTGIEAAGPCTWVQLEDLDGTPVTLTVRVPGRHNALNAVAAFTTGRILGIDAIELAEGLGGFEGIERRMNMVGTADEVSVRDSFAHHPTAISADLAAARTLTTGRTVVVFEPRGWARTAALGADMGSALAAADEIVLLPVHSTVTPPPAQIGTEEMAKAAVAAGGRVHQVTGLTDAEGVVAGLVRPGDLVLLMGTGEVNALGARILAHRATTVLS
ncbi:UDP-N-acetylmuramate--L-alanine ligase [Streptomyces sp. H27-H1]|uniref:UDP-N-acetylmuramate--L-alanine ligase n=1 Tax=Streptomyces sp. H27-H1 TaxID=2996461 RepID=UPI0022701F71|nr:UDP-N-acetylmuramate--L-alanine ligase [Streptomyces sp. H27-H1]MCY0930981.1 UDP-N-acetylmuramate--L-alanine ligase [Streptomyces sp. H27-H1]